MHEYHVDVHHLQRGAETDSVHINDEDHHSAWQTAQEFATFLADAINISVACTKSYRWVRKL